MFREFDAGSAGTGTTVRTCGNCGAHVTPRFARVMGDNQDYVWGCPECLTLRELLDGPNR